MLCTRCLSEGRPKRVTRGSLWIETILWLTFIVPGLIYSVWRLTTRHDACRACGSDELVPLNSPRARALTVGTRHSGGQALERGSAMEGARSPRKRSGLERDRRGDRDEGHAWMPNTPAVIGDAPWSDKKA